MDLSGPRLSRYTRQFQHVNRLYFTNIHSLGASLPPVTSLPLVSIKVMVVKDEFRLSSRGANDSLDTQISCTITCRSQLYGRTAAPRGQDKGMNSGKHKLSDVMDLCQLEMFSSLCLWGTLVVCPSSQ